MIGLALACLTLGASCLYLFHCSCPQLSRIGRRLAFGTFIGLGVIGLVAACHRADALAPLGLLAGLLVVAFLWESPREMETRES